MSVAFPCGHVLHRSLPLPIALAFLLAGSAQPLGAHDLELATRADRDGRYHSEGWLTVDRPAAWVRSVLSDFPRYREWATRGQDGRDTDSARFTSLLTGVSYEPDDRTLGITYDVNLVWPFGRKGNTARFRVEKDGRGGLLLRFLDRSAALDEALLRFDVPEGQASGSRVGLRLSVKLAWYLLPFFPLETYRRTTERRVAILLQGLSGRLQEFGEE